jgi:zinc protease
MNVLFPRSPLTYFRIVLRSAFFLLVLSAFCFGFAYGPAWAIAPVHRSVLSNDLVVLVSEEHSLPFVTIQLLIDAGSRKDPEGRAGLAYLTARSLLLGTSKRNVDEINETLDFMGASLGAAASRDFATVSLKVLTKDLRKGFNLFMDLLGDPVFPGEEIRREVEKTLAAIQSQEDEPEVLAEKAFNKALFLDSGYGHPVEGTKESLPGMTRDALLQFYGAYYHPRGSILSVSGDITAEQVKQVLLPRLEKWAVGESPVESFRVRFEKEPRTVKINRPLTQANILLGQAGVSRENPDYYALTVMNYILGGGGLDSRLAEEIRHRRGLAYVVASFFDPGKYPGSFQLLLQTKNSSAREAIDVAKQQVERIRKERVSEAELERAKKYLVGSFPMRFDTQSKLVNFLSQIEYYGLGIDYPQRYPSLIRSVTAEDVLRVAKKYLDPGVFIFVIVANLKETGLE